MFEAIKAALAAKAAAKAQARADQAKKAATFYTLTAGYTGDSPLAVVKAAAKAQARADKAKVYAAKTQAALEDLKNRRAGTVSPLKHSYAGGGASGARGAETSGHVIVCPKCNTQFDRAGVEKMARAKLPLVATINVVSVSCAVCGEAMRITVPGR